MRTLCTALVLLAATAVSQQPQLLQQATNSGVGLASLTVNLQQPPVPGNVLIICHDSTSGGLSSVTGGGVDQWILCQSSLPADNSEIWAGVVGSNPIASTLITLGGSPNSAGAIVSEWSGLLLPLVHSGATTTGLVGTAADPVVSGTVQAGANDLVIAMVGVHSGDNETITSLPTTENYTDLAQPVPTANNVMAAVFRIPTQAGPVSHSWTLGFAHDWASCIVVFRAAPVAGPTLAQQAANSGFYVPSLPVDLSQLPAAGNRLVVCLDTTSRRNCTVSGGGVGSWQLCQSTFAGSTLLLNKNVQVWSGVVDGAPAQRINIRFVDGRNNAGAVVSEWQGLGAPVTTVGASRRGFGGLSLSPVRTESLSVGAGDLVIGAAGTLIGYTRLSGARGGFTDLVRPPSSLYRSLGAAYLLPTAAGLAATSWTLNLPDVWATCIVVFRRP